MILYIVLPVYNRCNITRGFCSYLIESSFKNWKLILVDDGCTDNTVSSVKECIPSEQLDIVSGDGALWWGGAMSLAKNYLKNKIQDNDIALLINDDVVFDSDYLQNGIQELLKKREHIVYSIPSNLSEKSFLDYGILFNEKSCSFVKNTQITVSPDLCSTRGLFLHGIHYKDDPSFDYMNLPHYLSDYDYVLELKKKGLEITCNENVSLGVMPEHSGVHRLPKIWEFFTLRETLQSNRCSLNIKHWKYFIQKHSPNCFFASFAITRFYLLILKNVI